MIGKGFDAKESTENSISFADDVKGARVSNSKTTRTSIIVEFTHLSPSDAGSIKATATVDSRTGATSVVTTVVGSNPNVTENASNIDSDVDELTVKGTGFDAGTATANSIKFNGADIVRATLGASSKTTRTSLAVSFTHLSPSDAGDLGASVTVDTNFTSGSDVKVASLSLIHI